MSTGRRFPNAAYLLSGPRSYGWHIGHRLNLRRRESGANRRNHKLSALSNWANGFAEHAKKYQESPTFFRRLARFSPGRRACVPFPSLPTTWRGAIDASSFIETGGWAFVLVKHA